MYDAIVVGARCAGAPTAMLLARRGHRVLLLDKATFPSDTISTHILWPHGAATMDGWGLLDRLAATNCPPIARKLVFDVGPFALVGGVTEANRGRGGFCPRRTVLDALLAAAAAESGAELREAFTVEGLVWDGDRVVGLKGHGRNGVTVEERARVVVGADGVNSLVAKAVGPAESATRPLLTTTFYSYYSGFEAEDLEEYIRSGTAAGCFPTNDGLTLTVCVWPSDRFLEIRADVEGHVHKVHEEAPGVADRLRRARRETPWFGTAGVPGYLRKPYGPGWALVGDAGHVKDALTAQGISDAFLDADSLAGALHAGLSGTRPIDAALAEHHARRDERLMPMYDFTCHLAALEPPAPPLPELFSALRDNREDTNRFFAAITGARPLPEFMNPENLGRIIGRAGRSSYGAA